MRMKFINFLICSVLFSLALATGLSAQGSNGLQVMQKTEALSLKDDYSKFFVQEVIHGKYDLIKNVQNDTEIILRPDRIEILKKANSVTGAHEVTTYLLFSDVNKVRPQGQNLVGSSDVKIADLYSESTAQYLKSEFIEVNKYTSVIYPDFYNGVNLEVSLDKTGEMTFSLNPKGGSMAIPLNLNVLDSKVKSSTNGFVSNGVKVSSNSADLSIEKGKVDFKKRDRNLDGYSFTLKANNSSL